MRTKLENICKGYVKNIAQKDLTNHNGCFPIYGASGYIKNIDFYISDREYLGVVKDGAGVGRVDKYPAYSSLLGTMQYIVPNNDVDINYLKYLLISLHLENDVSGAAIPHIYYKNYKNTDVNICSFEKQINIAKCLDDINHSISLAKERLLALDELVKSRFIEMFVNKGFPQDLWKNVVYIINGKDYKKVPNDNQTYPIYGSGGYMGIRCDKYLCNEYSTIIGRKGNVTNPIFVTEKFWNVDTAFGIEVGERLNPYYFYHYTLTVDLSSMVSGAAIPSLTKTDLLALSIPIPPIELQNEFAEFVKLIDKSKFIVQQQIKDLQELLDSKMDEYFR